VRKIYYTILYGGKLIYNPIQLKHLSLSAKKISNKLWHM